MHVEYGMPIALNAGDALATSALRPLLDEADRLGSRMTRAVVAEFQRTMERTVEGQAVEIGWRTDNVVNLTPLDYLDMILRKTCAYTTILPLRTGALIGSWGAADLDAIAPLRLRPRRRVPDPGRRARPRERSESVRQGPVRRRPRGQADADARSTCSTAPHPRTARSWRSS